MASLAAVLTRRRRGPRRVFGFLALLAVGMGFLALDEQLGVHETIGSNLDFLVDIPGVGSPEDVIFALYAVPVTAFLVRYRALLLASPRGLFLAFVGILLFAAAAGLELASVPRVEQWIEPSASLALVAGLSWWPCTIWRLLACRRMRATPDEIGRRLRERDRSAAPPPST